MQVFRSWRWSALAVAFGLTTPAARAGMITPDSIPGPPSAVASDQGTPVYFSNVVTSQYKGLGLNFSSGAAITNLNGTSVWAPTEGLAHPDSSVAGVPPRELSSGSNQLLQYIERKHCLTRFVESDDGFLVGRGDCR
jgi:hypothetical protein